MPDSSRLCKQQKFSIFCTSILGICMMCKCRYSYSVGADLGPPSSKRRHTQAAEADKAVQNSHAHAAPGPASEQPMSSSSMQSQGSMLLPAHMPRTTHAEVASAQPIEALPAASHQTASHQDGANDNNAILWEPLVVRVHGSNLEKKCKQNTVRRQRRGSLRCASFLMETSPFLMLDVFLLLHL